MSKSNILVISPHPDDLEIGMGGTAAKLVEGGFQIVSLVATNGSGSTSPGGHSPEAIAAIRLHEMREAVSILGVQYLIPLPIDNVRTDDNREHFRNDLKQTLLRFRPAQVYMPHPDIDKHPTHRLVAAIALSDLRELVGAGETDAPEVWCYEVWTPFQTYDRIEDVSAHIELKEMAIEAHRSQISYRDYTEGIIGLNRYRAVFTERHGVSDMEFAEVFLGMKL